LKVVAKVSEVLFLLLMLSWIALSYYLCLFAACFRA